MAISADTWQSVTRTAVDMVVYVVEHIHLIDDEQEDIKMIGVYSTQALAEQAIARLCVQPGFRDTPEGFHASRYTIDEDHWTQGYVTVSLNDEETDN
jgi:hypothetical protein